MKPKFNSDSITHPSNADVAEKVMVRGIHLEITPALRDHAIDVGDPFAAKGHIEIGGPNLSASVRSGDAYKSLDRLSDRLDRMLREHSRARADRRNNGRASEKFRQGLSASRPVLPPEAQRYGWCNTTGLLFARSRRFNISTPNAKAMEK